MRRSEIQAWFALAALLAMGAVLLYGGVEYNSTVFWAGMCLVVGQAVVVLLAGWGIRLGRERAELDEVSPAAAVQGFRMSMEEGTGVQAGREGEGDVKTLDTSFQRLVVGLTAILLLGLAGVVGYLVYRTFAWAHLHLDQPFPIAGALGSPKGWDELALVMALAATAGYVIFYMITRPKGETVGTGEAVNSNFTLGLPAMIALGVAAVCARCGIAYATEIAAGVTAALMALQGLELLLNCFRSYSAIEELDQQAVDLQALPLVPMLSSVWLAGVRMLFAQSVGLSRGRENSVLARLLPRTLIAVVVIAIFISCLRAVPAGKVAVLERLGAVPIETNADGTKTIPASHLLQPGLHLCFPWPIDELVVIPTKELQLTDVGVELHGEKNAGGDKNLQQKVDFQFWTFQPEGNGPGGTETESEFVTGDPGSQQMLETYVVVLWEVSDPVELYTGLSHSEFYEKKVGSDAPTAAKPIYAELVQQCTSFAVTRTFAIHTLDQIMTLQRGEVEAHCKEILQAKLDDAKSGIKVVSLNITDLHPPMGLGWQALNPSARPPAPGWHLPPAGPASAYENIVNMMQFKEVQIQSGMAQKEIAINQAAGEAAKVINDAKIYQADTVAQAYGEAARVGTMMDAFGKLPKGTQRFAKGLAERQAMYSSLKEDDAFSRVNKIIVDPRVKNVDLYQVEKNSGQPRLPMP